MKCEADESGFPEERVPKSAAFLFALIDPSICPEQLFFHTSVSLVHKFAHGVFPTIMALK
jgi:hypothetical protein